MKDYFCFLTVLSCIWASNAWAEIDPINATEDQQNMALMPEVAGNSITEPVREEESKRWTSFLPLMADEVEKRGIELPLPFGISFNSVLLRRDVEVKEVAAAINGPPQNVDDYISIDTTTSVATAALRFDAWLLPFLNLYVLGGYVQNEPDLQLNFFLPPLIPGNDPREFSISSKGDLDGSVLGFGATLVGGYKDFFISLDANQTFADLGGMFDEEIDVMLYTVRTGWRGQVGNTMMNLWVGGMYWDAEREIVGSIPLPEGDTLNFSVLQEPRNHENYVAGMNVEISRSLQLVLEYGFNFDDVDILTCSFAYRF